jgi:hypothetical protein
MQIWPHFIISLFIARGLNFSACKFFFLFSFLHEFKIHGELKDPEREITTFFIPVHSVATADIDTFLLTNSSAIRFLVHFSKSKME